ncbi:uncharacterized protein LOC117330089 [Pecten maximus]|uniref:uncharacterized protein LOC117330089 n=1 Tax=Pecten maximus TaxID=6579 RepID=UPI001458FF8F|nr:uncharacterized protein LOC117330089 [Pecten maximus]
MPLLGGNNKNKGKEIKADDVNNTLNKLKDTVKDCKELHRKWEKGKHFEKDNSDYLGQANKLLCVVDEYRQQLDLPWPKTKSTEIEELKTRVNKLARERDDAEHRLDEAKLEIDRLKNRPREKRFSGRKTRQTELEKMPKSEHELEDEEESDNSLRARRGSIDSRGPSCTTFYCHDSASSQVGERKEVRNYASLQKDIEELKKSIRALQEDNKLLSDGRTYHTKTLNAARDEAARYKKQMETTDATVNRNRQEIERLKSQYEDLQESMKKELDPRLSAVADNKHSDNNPAIACLGDPNRPMKICEKVSELYDIEWTNAMENLENDMEEKDAIEVLLDIVTRVFITFEDIGDAQTDLIYSLGLHLAVPDIDDLRDTARSSLLDNGKLFKLPMQITEQLKNYRKASCQIVNPLLCEVMKSRLQTVYHMTGKTIKACEQFIKETVMYVWMMRVQDPPIHIEWEFSHGEKFDHDRLRSYTKSGDSVDYVVWPILYLHKGGPMLSKGVAQGMATKSK